MIRFILTCKIICLLKLIIFEAPDYHRENVVCGTMVLFISRKIDFNTICHDQINLTKTPKKKFDTK